MRMVQQQRKSYISLLRKPKSDKYPMNILGKDITKLIVRELLTPSLDFKYAACTNNKILLTRSYIRSIKEKSPIIISDIVIALQCAIENNYIQIFAKIFHYYKNELYDYKDKVECEKDMGNLIKITIEYNRMYMYLILIGSYEFMGSFKDPEIRKFYNKIEGISNKFTGKILDILSSLEYGIKSPISSIPISKVYDYVI